MLRVLSVHLNMKKRLFVHHQNVKKLSFTKTSFAEIAIFQVYSRIGVIGWSYTPLGLEHGYDN